VGGLFFGGLDVGGCELGGGRSRPSELGRGTQFCGGTILPLGAAILMELESVGLRYIR